MSKNTVSSLAILTVNWKVNKRDYIENFISFIATLIKKRNYKRIEINQLCSDFEEEFGLSIPFHPMNMILTRARKRGLIHRRYNEFVPIKEKIFEYEFSSAARDQLRKQEKVIEEIVFYALKKYNYEISSENAEFAFISFLKAHDLDILFAAEDKSILPEVHSSKKDKFIVYSFIRHAYEREPDIFQFIINTAIGHLMANSLLYRELNKFVSKLKNVCFYLDTKFIFRLLELEGEDRAIVYDEFLKTLVKEDACLYIFKHTYEEVIEILEDSLNWVESHNYDPRKATSVLRYFMERKYTKLDVKLFINKIDNILKESKIEIVEKPDKMKTKDYQISEENLEKYIIEIYKKFNPNFNELEKQFTIIRDINSIAAIYHLRKGKNPKHLKDSGHIFMTTNSGLALAARNFEISTSNNSYNIPACLTDTFVGTILWLQSPAKIFNINEKKIIADCYAALRPDSKLINKYICEVEKFKEERKIDENTYYLLRSDSMALKLLEEKTLGDANSFDSTTLVEIFEEFESNLKKKESIKLFEEKEKHKRTIEDYKTLKNDHKKMKSIIERRADKISKFISNVFTIIILSIFIICTITQIVPYILTKPLEIKIGFTIIYFIIAALNIIFGFNIFGFKHVIQKKISSLIIKYITDTN